MPQSLSSLLTHLVFSTKNREHSLKGDVASEILPYLQEEYRRFLDRYQITYDERYVWD